MSHDEQRMLTRRDLLLASLAAAAGAAVGGGRNLFAQGGAARDTGSRAAGGTSGSDLVILNERPLDAEAPLAALRAEITPTESFFVRSHFGPPSEIPPHWTLAIDGEVGAPGALSLADLKAMSAVKHRVTLECAGNGRGLYSLPNTSGVQWTRGAVSTAEWTGVPLGAVLERAKIKPAAAHFWMEALDHAPNPKTPKFLRSIPRDVALGNAFLAYEMNGAPIPLLHGGPLRLIVPGWFGMGSTKWLAQIHARTAPSDNQFMAKGYRYADGSPVEAMRVKSVIASPLADERVPAGTVRVTGQAWAGAGSGGVRAVDISTDGGKTWRPAQLAASADPFAWRAFTFTYDVRLPGPQSVQARATDAAGAVQPAAATPNPAGYANNSIHEVRFNAVRA